MQPGTAEPGKSWHSRQPRSGRQGRQAQPGAEGQLSGERPAAICAARGDRLGRVRRTRRRPASIEACCSSRHGAYAMRGSTGGSGPRLRCAPSGLRSYSICAASRLGAVSRSSAPLASATSSPVGPAVEAHADPALRPDVGRHEEALRVGADQHLLAAPAAPCT